MKISIEMYGRTLTFEKDSEDVEVAPLMREFCMLLYASGYSKEAIVQLFNEGETTDPFKWECLA